MSALLAVVAALLCTADLAAQAGDAATAPPEAAVPPPTVPSGWLGLTLELHTPALQGAAHGERTAATTIAVGRVFEGGPADRAGVRAGDRLAKVNGAVATPELVERVTRRLAPGDPVALTVVRGGRPVEVALTAEPRPAPGVLVPRTLQLRLDAAREVFVTGLRESLARLRDGASPELRARLAPVMEEMEARGLVPRVVVRTVDGDSVELVRLGAPVAGAPGGMPAEAGGRAGFRRPLEVGHVTWRQEEDGRLVIRADSAELDVTLRPLAPYLYGADRMAGARFIPLAPGLRSYFGTERGVVTAEVLPGAPAQRAGLRAGDVVTAVGSTPVGSIEELRAALARGRGRVALTVVRKGETLELELGR
jgi:hypothetical protein